MPSRSLPAGSRPAIVAISVKRLGNARANLLLDERKWKVVPEWRWGIGSRAQLASVWQRFHIAVLATTKKIAGVTVHEVAHTEASYVIDATGTSARSSSGRTAVTRSRRSWRSLD